MDKDDNTRFEKIFNEAKSKKGKVTVIYPQESKTGPYTKLDNVKNSIFLAGPCPRENYRATDWREKTYSILENLSFTGYVLNPTNENYNTDDKDALTKQTDWEWEAMCKASAIVFYLDRTDKNPGFTSNVEFGLWADSPGIYVCIPEGCTKNANRYIEIKCKEKGIPVYRTLEDCYAAVVSDLNRGGQNWYTSDTHFSQERTLTLSRRPFKDVRDMDLAMISKWNKRVRMQDTVYHLGDFGENFNYLDCLNFKTLNFNKGNYERDKIPEIMKQIEKRDDVVIYDNDECKVTEGDWTFTLRHEPVDGNKVAKGEYALFGHVHGRSGNVKENGIEVGVDINDYAPMSQEQVNFFANCLDKGYYDENVMCKECK